MNRTKWLIASICAVGWITLAWSAYWFVEQFSPEDNPGRMAYVLDEDVPPADIADAQRGWPSNLDDPGERKRLTAYLNDTKGTAPTPSAGGPGSREPEPLPDLGTLLASAIAADGESKARACISCHDFTSGGLLDCNERCAGRLDLRNAIRLSGVSRTINARDENVVCRIAATGGSGSGDYLSGKSRR